MTDAAPKPRFTYPRRFRLTGRRQFSAVFSHRVRRSAGPLTIAARPNGLGHNRVGLSVPRRVGNAVARNRVKRLIREAIRLNQHDLPAGYDLVISVRPHEPAHTLDGCAKLLATALGRIDRKENADLCREG
ncbi:MAG: ribonuclease P protein component [Planctomycetota bacterium]